MQQFHEIYIMLMAWSPALHPAELATGGKWTYNRQCEHNFCLLHYLWGMNNQRLCTGVWDVCVWGGVSVCVCVCVCAFALLILPRTFIWKHHDTQRTLHLYPKTGPRKTLAKNAENVMFYHLRGSALRGPQWTSNLTLYMRTYESSEV